MWLVLGAASCGGPMGTELVQVRLLGASQPPPAAAIHFEPAADVISARLGAQGWLAIERHLRARPLTLQIPEWCPLRLGPEPEQGPIELPPVIDLGPDRAPVGFDSRFEIVAKHGCAERGRGRITWRQLEGAPLSELSATQDGFVLRARTARFEALHPEAPPDGLVPISPRTQGRVVLEATWNGPGSAPIRRTITIRASSRATGVSSVAVSQQLLLSGADWRVLQAPQAGHAQIYPSGALSVFTPDAHGRWQLGRPGGETLTLQAFWHDKTPYDCGRNECHASASSYSLDSPMSTTLERALGAGATDAIGCRLECHVVGEPGLNDGGFVDVAAQLGVGRLDAARWHDLPQALRRLGGVRCTACHGPGAIPEPDARAQVLRSAVCATCHDAPPRYTHVSEWRESRMAGSDAHPSTRAGSCAGCHTTAGFLAAIGAASQPKAGPEPPRELAPMGIACAACHAPHASHSAARLIRSVPLEPNDAHTGLPPASALCLACHTPNSDEAQPSASSGTLWLGSARLPSAEGEAWEELRGAAAHRALPGGCIGCHGARPAQARAKLDHSFRVEPSLCTGCHEGRAPELTRRASERLQQRTAALAAALERVCPSAAQPVDGPRHAKPEPTGCRTRALTRARYALALVEEDPAAAIHNATFANTLLDEVEALTDFPLSNLPLPLPAPTEPRTSSTALPAL